MTTRFITQMDGTLQFVKRGLPPDELPGYEADPNDPYLFHPILPPCAARTYKNLDNSDCCPIGRHLRHCSKFGYYSMTPETCKMCAEAGNHVPIVELGTEKLSGS